MILGNLIFAATLALLLCWFRYACRLILTAQSSRGFGTELAGRTGLEFPRLRAAVATAPPATLDEIGRVLDREYALVAGWLAEAPAPAWLRVEEELLKIDYRLQSAWLQYAPIAPFRWRSRSAAEMCEILSHLADSAEHRAAPGADVGHLTERY